MTTEREPSMRDIQALVAYLPELYGEGAPRPVVRWIAENSAGGLTLPWPEYNETVQSFIDLIVSQGCWMDTGYDPETSKGLLMDEAVVRNATIPEIRRMLTLIVRGERFCDGWWSSMIEEGHVQRLLERLAELTADG